MVEPIRLLAKRLLAGPDLEPVLDAAILVEGSKIVALGPRAKLGEPADCVSIDLGSATLMAGMIDAHMHTFGVSSTGLHALPFEREPVRALTAAAELRELLHAGFTSARCLGSSVGPDLKRAIAAGFIEGPRLLAAGRFLSSTSGTWDAMPVPLAEAAASGEIADGPDGFRTAVRQRVRDGADFIKLGLSKGPGGDRYHSWGDDPARQATTMTVEEVRAAVDEAHRNGIKVSAHAIGDAAVNLALDGGVDVVEHGYGIAEETRRRLIDTATIVVTTISQLHFHRAAYDAFHYPAWERAVYERHWMAMKRDFERGLAAGVRFALGTDLIGRPTHPLKEAAMEFIFATEWGMSTRAALQAGTARGAEVLGLEATTGIMAEGMTADVIGLDGDPTADIAAVRRVSFVMKAGAVVRNSLPASGSMPQR